MQPNTPKCLQLSDGGDRARRVLLPYIAARIGDREDAEDIVQECLLVGATNASLGDSDPLPFLLGVARHKSADWWRRCKARSVALGEVPDRADEADGPAELAERMADVMLARRVLAALPARDAELLELRMAGLTAVEVGRALTMSAGAVRVAQHRALTRARAVHAAIAARPDPSRCCGGSACAER